MYPIIGIVLRSSKSETNKDIDIVYKDIENAIIKSNGIPIGVVKENIDKYLDICKGFIFQGGDDIEEINLKSIKLLQEKNIPVLGICLGMQEMAVCNNGELYDIDNHLSNILHEVKITKGTLLYDILKKDKILVNTRHKSAVKETKLIISSVSKDYIIESVEDKNCKFFMGLQWHLENLYDIDPNSKKIFDYFINICNN